MAGDPFYKSAVWREFRKKFKELHPICYTPLCGKPTSHVDHIVSRQKGGAWLDPKNFQPKCWSCHSRKTAMVDGGFGNRRTSGTTGVIGCDEKGQPLDPEHRWNRSNSRGS